MCLLYFSFITWYVYGLSNISSKPTNVMLCHEVNKQNQAGDDEVDDYAEKS